MPLASVTTSFLTPLAAASRLGDMRDGSRHGPGHRDDAYLRGERCRCLGALFAADGAASVG
eukprot:357850-Chlamydomonas_euryale.AAC.4